MVTNMAAYVGSSQGSEKHRIAATQLIGRLKNCWSCDIDWDKHPRMLREVYMHVYKEMMACLYI